MPEADSSLSYPALMEYKNVIIERLFRRYISELKQLNPDLAIVVGSNSWPAMVEDHTTEFIQNCGFPENRVFFGFTYD